MRCAKVYYLDRNFFSVGGAGSVLFWRKSDVLRQCLDIPEVTSAFE